MDKPSLERILKAKKAEERAIENAKMKMLYSAYVESGLEIEEAIQLLKDRGKVQRNECCERPDVNHKSAEEIRQGKKAREEKKQQSTENEHSDNNCNQVSTIGDTKPEKPAFL